MTNPDTPGGLQELRAAVRRNGNDAADLHALGVALTERGEYRRSLVYLRAAAARNPADSTLLHHLATALLGCGRADEVARVLEQGLRIDPERLESWKLLGSVLLDHLNRPEDALRSFCQAIQLAPGEIRNYESAALCRLGGSVPEALQDTEDSLPHNADPVNVRRGTGLALAETGRYEEAIEVFQELLCCRPDDLVALEALARIYTSLHDFDGARCCLERALPLAGRSQRELFLGYLMHWTRLGDLERARKFYRARMRKVPVHVGFPRAAPVWEGQEVPGKTVRLIAGGMHLGDAIQFVRFASVVRQAGARVLVQGPTRIRSLLRTVPGVDLAFAPHDQSPPFDYDASAFLLLYLSDAPLEEMLGKSPYMEAEPGLRAAWRNRFRSASGLNVGIVWRGSPYHARNRYACRSMALEELRPLTAIPCTNLYSLQRGPGREELTHATRAFSAIDLAPDFPNAAAAIRELDLVVTIDTSIAHLAGALGKRTYVMLPYDACSRWMIDRDDTPWYPDLRLFRQRAPGQWSSVVAEVAAAVHDLAREKAVTR